ncbi:outer membrane protein assembly factor [uncultured Maribacter sp.]|uniref:outer membrane protein assembly factor n=1 Tax=uncultured Maribacter sp. TaxID=431308 RepID=UPI00262A5316|nr:outer membrane protein assembly factor [uncultured Maribacter sp.]
MKKLYSFFLLIFVFLNGYAQKETITEVTIKGTKKTKVSFLKKLIKVEARTELDSTVLISDIEHLKRLPFVASANFSVVKKIGIGYEVVYQIEENFTLIPFANLFSSSNDDFAFRVGLQEFNFLGKGVTLGAFYQYDIFNSFGVNIRAPYLFNSKLGLAINYKDLTTQEPVFFDNTSADYKYNNNGVEVLGLYQINFKNRVEFGYSAFTEDYKYISGAQNTEVPLALNVDKHLWKLIYNYDNIDYHYQYLSGFRSYLNFQYVGSTDTNLPEFLIGFNDFTFFKRIGEKGNWASRVRLGLATNIDTPFAPFTVDNNINIRGVGNTIDRGTAAIIVNTEYRHTLVDKDWFVLQSNVFVDGGSWRNPGGDFGDFSDTQNLRIYPGVGLRFMHKKIFNAIFRIDYGYGITQDASRGLVFGIGQYF